MANLADTQPGRVLDGRYRLGERLGQGGCATVYAALDELLDRQVAVKIWDLPCEDAANEARMAARLRHPGVVVVHDARAGDDISYLVMERVLGGSLAAALRDGPLPENRCVHVVAQLCRTLALVHRDRVVHGDVKPANVLLGPGDQVILTDFGVASPARTRYRANLPRTVRGTPPYLSPEQVRGQRLTPATDVYAAGLLLLEALTGTRAYGGSPQEAALARLQRAPLVPSWVAPDLAALVRAMTSLDPADRPSAREAARRLEERDGGSLAEATQPFPVAGDRRWSLLVGASLVALVAILAVTGPQPQAATPRAAVPGAAQHAAPRTTAARPVAPAPVPRPTAASSAAAAARATAQVLPRHVKHGHGHHGKKG